MNENLELTQEETTLMLRCINTSIATFASHMVISELMDISSQDCIPKVEEMKKLFDKIKKATKPEEKKEEPKKEKIKTLLVSVGNDFVN